MLNWRYNMSLLEQETITVEELKIWVEGFKHGKDWGAGAAPEDVKTLLDMIDKTTSVSTASKRNDKVLRGKLDDILDEVKKNHRWYVPDYPITNPWVAPVGPQFPSDPLYPGYPIITCEDKFDQSTYTSNTNINSDLSDIPLQYPYSSGIPMHDIGLLKGSI